MSSVKKPVALPVEDFKFITDWFAPAEKALTDKWVTPELVTTITTAVTNLAAVAVLLGWLSTTEVETLTKAITALVTASEVIVVNSVLIWKFIASRNALKAQVLESKYRYVEAVAVERLRAN
jgi:hypothetical protein